MAKVWDHFQEQLSSPSFTETLIFAILPVDHEVLPWSKINLAKIHIWQREKDVFIGHI